MQYFLLPNLDAIAKIPKGASRAFAKSTVISCYPGIMSNVNTTLPEEERFADDNLWLSLCPVTEDPQGTVFMLVRDPVERFLSACAMLNMSIDEALADLSDMHFAWQVDYTKTDRPIKLYRFPDGMNKLCADAGIAPLDKLGGGPVKPVPSPAQYSAIRAIYADDVKLFEGI